MAKIHWQHHKIIWLRNSVVLILGYPIDYSSLDFLDLICSFREEKMGLPGEHLEILDDSSYSFHCGGKVNECTWVKCAALKRKLRPVLWIVGVSTVVNWMMRKSISIIVDIKNKLEEIQFLNRRRLKIVIGREKNPVHTKNWVI